MNKSIKPSQKKADSWTSLTIVIALTLVACAVAVILRLFSVNDLPFQTFAALIGVIITAIITGVLLKGQSKAERLQKEQSEIFKEKLATYNRFLDALCTYVETKDEKAKSTLKFRTAALAMHCDNDQMIKTNQTVGEIIGMYNSADVNDEKLLTALFSISDSFREALYAEQCQPRTDAYNTSIRTLTDTFETGTDASDAQDESIDTQQLEQAIEQEAPNVVAWNDYLGSLKAKGWNADIANDQINLTKTDAPASIRFRKPRKGTFYVVEVLTAENDKELPKELQSRFKGSRSGGSWWRELTSLRTYGIKSGQLTSSLADNAKARTVVIKWITNLTEAI